LVLIRAGIVVSSRRKARAVFVLDWDEQHFTDKTPTDMAKSAHAPSYYAHSAHAAPRRQPLTGPVEADVCIVGAGYTGLSAGIALAEAGKRVVILE